MIQQHKIFLTELFQTALDTVNGHYAVANWLKNHPVKGAVAVVAIGKAASSMLHGAQFSLDQQIQSALVITKAGYADPSLNWPCIQASHPVPDASSLDAGDKLLKFIKSLPDEMHLLTLISGGTSALVEVLPENVQLEDLQKINQWLLASGLAIAEINRVRQSVSMIKAGKILDYSGQRKITQLLISDVKNDDPGLIGSGLFVGSEQTTDLPVIPDWINKYIQKPPSVARHVVSSHIVASNKMACQAIIQQAEKADFQTTYHGQTLYGDVFEIAEQLTSALKIAKPGIHLWGGETTVVLPDSPGRGGRNQSLALALACGLAGSKGITVLVAATDGSDGPTDDAGGIIDGSTIKRGEVYPGQALDALNAADAGTFLAEAGDLISTGPTGTNVMDLVIALVD